MSERDKFVDAYMARSNLDPKYRTYSGFQVHGSQPRVALRCACGNETCEGWAMVGLDNVDWHLKAYAPEDSA